MSIQGNRQLVGDCIQEDQIGFIERVRAFQLKCAKYGLPADNERNGNEALVLQLGFWRSFINNRGANS
jgi:hypothetical protein